MAHKKATTNELLRKIEENRSRRKKDHLIYSKALGMELAVKMIPLDELLEILSVERADFAEQMEAYKHIIYVHCPMLHSKELQSEEYIQPYDVVLDVFDNNLEDIGNFAEQIIDLYGMGTVKTEIKN